MTTLILHGPKGSGKTIYARAIAAFFGCQKAIYNWNPAIQPNSQRFSVHVRSLSSIARRLSSPTASLQ